MSLHLGRKQQLAPEALLADRPLDHLLVLDDERELRRGQKEHLAVGVGVAVPRRARAEREDADELVAGADLDEQARLGAPERLALLEPRRFDLRRRVVEGALP